MQVKPSEKALRDFAYRVLIGEINELRPGTVPAEVHFFVEQLDPAALRKLYYMMYTTGLVQ